MLFRSVSQSRYAQKPEQANKVVSAESMLKAKKKEFEKLAASSKGLKID